MLIQCDPKYLQPSLTRKTSYGKDVKEDVVFDTPQLSFCIGVNTYEIDTIKKADQFVKYMYTVWEKAVLASVEKRATPCFITDKMKTDSGDTKKFVSLNMGYASLFKEHNQKFFKNWYDIVRKVIDQNVKFDKRFYVNYYNGVKDDQYYEYKRYMDLISTGLDVEVDDSNKTVSIYTLPDAKYPKWKPKKSPSKLLKKTQQEFPGYELKVIESHNTTIRMRAESLDELNNMLKMFGNTINTESRVYVEVPKYDSSKFPGAPRIKLDIKGIGTLGIEFIYSERPADRRLPIKWEFYTNTKVHIRNPYFYGW